MFLFRYVLVAIARAPRDSAEPSLGEGSTVWACSAPLSIVSSSSRDNLQTTAFVNPDGKIVVVVLNMSEEKLPYYLWVSGQAAETVSLPHSISTLIIG